MPVATQLIIDWAQVSLLSMAIGFLFFETGMLSLGHAGALLVGAYCVAFLALGQLGWLPVMLLLMVVIGGLGLSSLRVRGDIFAVISLALAEALRFTALGAYGLTKGALGLGPIPWTWLRTDSGAAVAGLLAVGGVAAVYILVVRGWPGLALGAIRDNELVARGLGFATLPIMFSAVALSCLVAALSGGLQVAYYGIAYPTLGRLEVSLMAFAAVKLASPLWRQGRPLRSVTGQLGGTAVIVALPPFLRWMLPGSIDAAVLREILFGVLLYLLVLPPDWLARATRWVGARRPQAAAGARGGTT